MERGQQVTAGCPSSQHRRPVFSPCLVSLVVTPILPALELIISLYGSATLWLLFSEMQSSYSPMHFISWLSTNSHQRITYINTALSVRQKLFSALNNYWFTYFHEVGSTILPMLQIKKLRHREIKWSPKALHPEDLCPGGPVPESLLYILQLPPHHVSQDLSPLCHWTCSMFFSGSHHQFLNTNR